MQSVFDVTEGQTVISYNARRVIIDDGNSNGDDNDEDGNAAGNAGNMFLDEDFNLLSGIEAKKISVPLKNLLAQKNKLRYISTSSSSSLLLFVLCVFSYD
jgi:hypothetical protein